MAGKHIPEDIVVDILSRLPIKSLIRFSCVSKRWDSIVSDPQFAKLQFKVASSQQTSSRRLLLCNVYRTESIDLETPLFSGANFRVRKLILRFKQPKYTDKKLLGSCNGLVCLSITTMTCTTSPTELYIWNPSTGFLLKLPNPEFSAKLDDVFYSGFGHVSATDDYKVVVAVPTSSDKKNAEVKIFSCRTGLWKRIGSPITRRILSHQRGALLRETLHWISDDHQRRELFAFDLVKEEFRKMPLPNFDQELRDRSEHLVCDSWGGCLHVFRYPFYSTSYVELWVMREYGFSGSWSKLFNVQLASPPERQLGLFPFMAMETSTIVAKASTDCRSMEMMRIEHKGELLVMGKLDTLSEMIMYEESLLQIPDYH